MYTADQKMIGSWNKSIIEQDKEVWELIGVGERR
jgi:hypothetical protein